MKKLYFVFLLFPLSGFAQSPVTLPAGTGETSPSSACMACAGSIWNNEMNITVSDAQTASVSLNPSGFCFQSTCSYSRYLYAHNFGFAIPGTATIDSIFVDVRRAGSSLLAIKDSIVQLYDGTTNVGNNLGSSGTWNNAFATVTYGHNDPLWGASWSPSIINNSGMGLMFKVKNLLNSQQTAVVDFVQMTIYYTTPTGVYSVTSSPSSVKWIYSGNEIHADVNLNSPSVCSGSLYDLTGRSIQTKNYGTLDSGINQLNLDIETLPEGIYLWKLCIGDELFIQKIIVAKK